MKKNLNPQTIYDEDTELIKAITSGKTPLFYDLVKKYQGKLYNFGLRLCPEARDAEEMVQDTFLNAYRYLSRFRFESQFKTWLYKIAGSACTKKKRRAGGFQSEEIPIEDMPPGQSSEMADRLPKWVSEPLARILNEELSEKIRKPFSRSRRNIVW